MTLEEYVESMRTDLDAFQDDWREHNKFDNEMFPLDMSTGDWDEHFITWSGQRG